MPKRKLAWAAWNYHLGVDGGGVAVTYWMNELQSLPGPTNRFVTLNDVRQIDPAKILKRITYHHPIIRREGLAAQKRWSEIQGAQRTWFCGAYWSYGFHEDGVNSALRVAERFGRSLDDLEQRDGDPHRAASAHHAACQGVNRQGVKTIPRALVKLEPVPHGPRPLRYQAWK